MNKKNFGLIPLRNFGIVDPIKGIYRSAQPLYAYEYKWLEEVLGIKTIINLRSESSHDDKVLTHLNSNIVVLDVLVPDKGIPTIEQCDMFMRWINTEKLPLLFHCEHGHGRTSTFCVLARLAQGWSLEAAIREEEEKFHYTFKHHAQKEFLIENFSNYEMV